MSAIQRLCVYCASSPGDNATITATARNLGELLAAEGIELVYGGGTVGLMGLIADTVMAAGGSVTGVIPTALFSQEIPHRKLSRLVEVESMHERKMAMFTLADAFIALPGGWGTLEEITEVTTWAQIGTHSKPVGLLNADGYYDHLLAWMDRAVQEGLLRKKNRDLLLHASEPAPMLAALRAHAAAHPIQPATLPPTL